MVKEALQLYHLNNLLKIINLRLLRLRKVRTEYLSLLCLLVASYKHFKSVIIGKKIFLFLSTTIFPPSILVFGTYQKESALGGDEEEVELFLDYYIRENAENYEREIVTPAQRKKKNLIYHGMYGNQKLLMNLIENN